jgi:hypothetical protein
VQKNEISLYNMFIREEISCIWKPEEKEKEKKSPLEKGYKKNSSSKVYNGKNRKRRVKQ